MSGARSEQQEISQQSHRQTANGRGFMHPISPIGKKFALFSASINSPVVDMGCAYGNTTVIALEAGAKMVIACDMEQDHLSALQETVDKPCQTRLVTKLGLFPNGFDFTPDMLGAIHASHILEYLNGDEVEIGLKNCFKWLHQGGKLFILTYTIHILELANVKFKTEYEKRLQTKIKWPGYLENFDTYSQLPDEIETISSNTTESPFPPALHMFDLPLLVEFLQSIGFKIEEASYLDGRLTGAVKETWRDGREYIGVIAYKP